MEQSSDNMMTRDKDGLVSLYLQHNLVQIIVHLRDCDYTMSHEMCL